MLDSVPLYRFALAEGASGDFLPKQGEPTATGWDVRAYLETDFIEVAPFDVVKIPLGFRVLCPVGWWLELRPRSSSFAKRNLHSLYGVIDQDYSGVCCFVCQHIPDGVKPILEHSQYTGNVIGVEYPNPPLVIKHGDALGQLVPVRRVEMSVEQVSNEEYDRLVAERGAVRGSGGFGSTDKEKK